MNHFAAPLLARIEATSELLVTLRSENGASKNWPRLYCIHHSGGDIGIYRKLVKQLPGRRAVVGIQSRLDAGQQLEFPSISSMATGYANLLNKHQPDGPLYLLGFSFGGFVATKIAEELSRLGREVGFLGLIDSNIGWLDSPETSNQQMQMRLVELFRRFQSIGVMNLQPIEKLKRDVSRLVSLYMNSDQVLATEILDTANQMGYIPDAGVTADVLGQFTFKFITHCRLLRNFEPSPIHCPLHVWWPSDRGKQKPVSDDNRSLRWSDFANQEFSESTLPGNHFSMMRMPSAKQLAVEIDQHLKVADESSIRSA